MRPSRIALLARVEPFSLLPPELLPRLARRARRRLFSRGSFLVRQGDRGDALHVIVQGRVRLEAAHPALRIPVVLTELWPGQVVGEYAVLDGHPRAASAIAVEETETLEFCTTALLIVLAQDPAATAALRALSARIGLYA